jgi:hypothetical protein
VIQCPTGEPTMKMLAWAKRATATRFPNAKISKKYGRLTTRSVASFP